MKVGGDFQLLGNQSFSLISVNLIIKIQTYKHTDLDKTILFTTQPSVVKKKNNYKGKMLY